MPRRREGKQRRVRWRPDQLRVPRSGPGRVELRALTPPRLRRVHRGGGPGHQLRPRRWRLGDQQCGRAVVVEADPRPRIVGKNLGDCRSLGGVHWPIGPYDCRFACSGRGLRGVGWCALLVTVRQGRRGNSHRDGPTKCTSNYLSPHRPPPKLYGARIIVVGLPRCPAPFRSGIGLLEAAGRSPDGRRGWALVRPVPLLTCTRR